MRRSILRRSFKKNTRTELFFLIIIKKKWSCFVKNRRRLLRERMWEAFHWFFDKRKGAGGHRLLLRKWAIILIVRVVFVTNIIWGLNQTTQKKYCLVVYWRIRTRYLRPTIGWFVSFIWRETQIKSAILFCLGICSFNSES